MKALFVHSHVFLKKSNTYYSEGKLTYEIWKSRYLRYFDELFIATRARTVDSIENLNISSGKNIHHIDLPGYSSFKDRLTNKGVIKNKLKELIKKNKIDVVIVRLPSAHGLIALQLSRDLNLPVVIEMVGDPFDALWNHGHPYGKIYAPINFLKYRKALKNSDNIIFVTENYLQKRYITTDTHNNHINISNVNLTTYNEDFMLKRLNENKLKDKIKIATIGSFSSRYKALDDAIEVISILNKKNYDVSLYILGSGNNKYLKNIVKRYQLEEKVHFVGSLKGGKEVIEWLNSFDIYIHPSLTEGLPRAIIEAMSVGLPVVASNVGGIPELIDENMLTNPKDVQLMSQKIIELINDDNLYAQQVRKNFFKSKEFSNQNLLQSRDLFWKKFYENIENKEKI